MIIRQQKYMDIQIYITRSGTVIFQNPTVSIYTICCNTKELCTLTYSVFTYSLQ
jgi:hypothetical protein